MLGETFLATETNRISPEWRIDRDSAIHAHIRGNARILEETVLELNGVITSILKKALLDFNKKYYNFSRSENLCRMLHFQRSQIEICANA